MLKQAARRTNPSSGNGQSHRGVKTRDIIVIGGSAGAIEAITQLLAQIPENFPAAIFIVYHIHATSPGGYDRVLNLSCKLPVKYAHHAELISRGTVYLAVPDHHLLLRHERMSVTKGPRENRSRPAIDPLFRSAAVTYGSQVIGIVLSGNLDDGTAGLAAVKKCGGIAIVQNPECASFPEMPRNALAAVDADHCIPIAEMGAVLEKLVRQKVPASPKVPEIIERENRFMSSDSSEVPKMEEMPGELTTQICPDCGGPLWEVKERERSRFRCHTGHAYSQDWLLVDQSEAIERALWCAVRMLEERAKLYSKMARDGNSALGKQYKSSEEESTREADTIRDLILRIG